MLSRRGFLVGLFATPPIVKIASLMPLAPQRIIHRDHIIDALQYSQQTERGLLTAQMITRETVKLWNTNTFLSNFEKEYARTCITPISYNDKDAPAWGLRFRQNGIAQLPRKSGI
jgi:hypothetical protein